MSLTGNINYSNQNIENSEPFLENYDLLNARITNNEEDILQNTNDILTNTNNIATNESNIGDMLITVNEHEDRLFYLERDTVGIRYDDTIDETSITNNVKITKDLVVKGMNITNDITAIQAVNATQTTNINNNTNAITAIQAVNATQTTNITTNTNAITAIQAVNTTQTTNITNNTNAITAIQAVNATQTTNITTNTNAITAIKTKTDIFTLNTPVSGTTRISTSFDLGYKNVSNIGVLHSAASGITGAVQQYVDIANDGGFILFNTLTGGDSYYSFITRSVAGMLSYFRIRHTTVDFNSRSISNCPTITTINGNVATNASAITAIQGVNAAQTTNITNNTNAITAIQAVNATQTTNITNNTNAITDINIKTPETIHLMINSVLIPGSGTIYHQLDRMFSSNVNPSPLALSLVDTGQPGRFGIKLNSSFLGGADMYDVVIHGSGMSRTDYANTNADHILNVGIGERKMVDSGAYMQFMVYLSKCGSPGSYTQLIEYSGYVHIIIQIIPRAR